MRNLASAAPITSEKPFATKASDRLIQALDIRMYATERESLAPSQPSPQFMVLELDTPTVLPAPVPELAAAVPASVRKAATFATGYRTQRARELRDYFYSTIAPMRAALEKKLARPAAIVRESLQDLGSATDLCWLNGTMRAVAQPKAVADIVGDPKITRIGIPQALSRELNITGVTIGAIRFRKANPVTGKGVVVAVIDGEVDATHPALKDRVMQKKNYTREPWGHPDIHGTGIAGMVGSADAKFQGMAPGVMIANYKIFNTDGPEPPSDFDATVALQQALEDGALIANCSWGSSLSTDGKSRSARACDKAWDLGLVVVKSAGNKGPDAASMTSPAEARGIIVAGATDRKGKGLEGYSGRGPIAAKKGPDLVVPGGAENDEISSLLVGGGTGGVGAGTSFAAPHVVGLIALLLGTESASDSRRSESSASRQVYADSRRHRRDYGRRTSRNLGKRYSRSSAWEVLQT